MTTPRLHAQAAPFMGYLKQYKDDRGALANLRGALSESRRPNAWPLLGGFKGAIGNLAFETVAALWAGAPDLDAATGNLGDTLAGLKGENNSFEGRFKRLLTCRDTAEIAERVAPVVRAAQAKGMRVNHTQLLSDLLWWDSEFNPPKVAWARSFWGTAKEEEDAINPDLLDKEGVST